MRRQLRNPHFYFLILTDILLFAASLFLAYSIRFSMAIPPSVLESLLRILPWVILTKLVTFNLLGAYRGMWRYTSLSDIQHLFEACFVSSLLIIAALTFATRFQGYPRSVFLADFIFTFFLTGGMRTAIRLFYAPHTKIAGVRLSPAAGPKNRIRLLLIGAGDAADKIIREVFGNPRSQYEIVCCLDDDPLKQGRYLMDIPIMGPIENLADYETACDVHEVLICMPSVGGGRMRTIVEICEASGLPFRTLPSLTSLIDGNVTIENVRPVAFEDLLGRPPVSLDMVAIGQYLTGKTVAITGAGGSIGSELCRQIIHFNPQSLLLIDSSEFNLYTIEMELRTIYPNLKIYPLMGRVQDRPLMDRLFSLHQPQIVFHAAACKHVPMVEANPWEGIHNNVVGSHTIMDVAEAHGAERFVLISTDKAVRPTSVMGATKRAAEILLQARPQTHTRFMAVRFGNVVGSSGSAIPLFQRQIKAGGPVTVTHPDITRYFMTIPEACQLVLQAGSLGTGGEIFILEMGTPVKIADMARDLIRLSGKEPDVDIPITFIGLRPGEKLYEELITHGEGINETSHNKIMVLRRDHAYQQHPAPLVQLDALVSASSSYDATRIKTALSSMMPEYTPHEETPAAKTPPHDD